MKFARNGLIVAALHCAIVLSLSGKLLYDRSTCPRVWMKTMRWDPALPIRGRYLALRLRPESGSEWFARAEGQRVLFFVPEHSLPFELERTSPEIWAEVTIPRKGPPRPIRLGLMKDGRIEPLAVN